MAKKNRRRRGKLGFWGPFPSYSRETRRGGRVRVTGCCLPLTLVLTAPFVAGAAAGARAVGRRVAR